jgi:hypothetical protein
VDLYLNCPYRPNVHGAHRDKFTFIFIIVIASTIQLMLWRQVKEDELGRECSMDGRNTDAYQIVIAKPDGLKLFLQYKRRRNDNIETDVL